MGKKRSFGECKRSSSRVQGKDKCRSKETEKIGYGRRKRLQEGRITREIYSKDIV